MNYKKFTFSVSSIERIKKEIEKKLEKYSEDSNDKEGISSRFTFLNSGKKVTLTFFRTGKGLIQGNPSKLFDKVESSLRDIENINFTTDDSKEQEGKIENGIYEKKEIIIGLDEAGRSDIIGDMVQSLVILPKEKLELFRDLPKNIKSMGIKQLNYYCGLIKKKGIIYDYIKLTPKEITYSELDIVRLIDKKYIALISRHAGILNSKCAICLDDYGIKSELKTYLENRVKTGAEVFCEPKLDEKITATKLASIVSRHIRLTELSDISERNSLMEDGKKIEFGKGSNNSQTEKWLETYRIRYPYIEFPDFVRKGWANVTRIEERLPKKDREILFECPHCKKNISKILCFLDKTNNCIKCYCSICVEILDNSQLKNLKLGGLLCDTNAFVSGILSRDINSSDSVFYGTCIIKLHKIINEIDTISWGQKRGAQNELQRLKECEQSGKITISIRDYEITHPWDADTKLYGEISKNNGWALISGDYNVADNSHCDGAFVFKIMTFDPKLAKK